MNTLLKIFNLTFLGAGYFLICSSTYAGQMYVYQDKDGGTLLTNRKDQSLKSIKVTYYPDSNIHNYSNWGANEAAVLPSYSQGRNNYDHIIQRAAQTHRVSAGLIKAVMHTESGFNPSARSPVGAQGLMQLMPATAKRFNVSNAFDPEQNILAGSKYLSILLKRFNGNTHLALAAYNAGEGNVSKYGGIPPFKETRDYVQRVTSRYNNLYAQDNLKSNLSTQYSSNQQITTTTNTNNVSNSNFAQTPIVIIGEGRFSDQGHTFSTTNATATAKISISP
ncbi:lytic transglycosylase domain-containing protein [Acinetobacter rudis]|uniref:Transglycosylase SLT domain-containing protein n=1 Tax=Acinetobacter rudis CIP 110305 TaxID=421052 RepID=S3MYV3_9GAMM|nr:lytic transglycosylase domain-containing protein [Acinetobacter rudis]EPF71583.1 hypothetical protein F945_02616 [Acinetobacter rudis CIP 110305]